MTTTRYGLVTGPGCDARTVAAYLPGNYEVVSEVDGTVLIAGHDDCGWTLQDYVAPRLASGLYATRELTEEGELAVVRYACKWADQNKDLAP